MKRSGGRLFFRHEGRDGLPRRALPRRVLFAVACVCFALDADGALDVVLALLAHSRPLLTVLYGVVLACAALAVRGARGEAAGHVRARARCVWAAVLVPLGLLAHAPLATLGLLALAFALAETPVPAAGIGGAPLVLVGALVALMFLDVPFARSAIVRRISFDAMDEGTLVYVQDWGFIDHTHANASLFRQVLSDVETGAPDIGAYVELVDAWHAIHVVERPYAVEHGHDAPWAIACAIMLDLGERAEHVQATTDLSRGIALSAYRAEDLNSNLFGCLVAGGFASPHAIDRDPARNRARYRVLGFDRRRTTRYALPPSATAHEREGFAAIERARRHVVPGEMRTYIHPVSR